MTIYKDLEELLDHKQYCASCPAGAEGNKVVLPTGDKSAVVLVLGRNPGKQEFNLRQPFVGRSGQLLMEWLRVLGISKRICFLENTIACYTRANRPPAKEELEVCWNLWLQNEIKLLKRCRLAVALGVEATEALGGGRPGEMKRGHLNRWTLYLPHPGAALRNKDLEREISHVLLPDLRERVYRILEGK